MPEEIKSTRVRAECCGFTTKAIAARQQSVLLMTHVDDDGAWKFLPLEGERKLQDAAVVSLRSMIEHDGTLASLLFGDRHSLDPVKWALLKPAGMPD